jgi:uncharacterized membrane protein YjfL (UPF0719 family)
MATIDPYALGRDLLSTLFWTAVSLLMAGATLVLVDKLTPHWFDLRSIENNPMAVAIVAAGVIVGLSVIIAAVLVSP